VKEINIYVGLTEMQRKCYRSVLKKVIDITAGKLGDMVGVYILLIIYVRSFAQ
jgi:SWI/SNF-related matrix-associated actin-dependent regulator of chromatin subfamily A member 5